MEIIQRYSNPTKYDLAKYGTLCINNDTIYIQVSKDPEASKWITLGEMLAIAYQGSIESKDFIENCLMLYESNIVEKE